MTHDEEAQGWPTASGHWGQDACPGSFNMQKGIPEEPPTADALFGILVHECLAGRLVYEALTEEERECAQRTELRIGVILDQCGFGGGEPTERETRLWLSNVVSPPKKLIPPHLQISGKPDVVFMRPDRLLIIDVKTGRNTIPANAVNKQLRRLAVLARRNFGVSEIWTSIAQPWAANQPPCKYTAEDLDKAEAEMWAELEVCMKPDAPLVAGDWCRYCRARAVCSKSTATVNYLASQKHPDKRLELCTPAQLSELGSACAIAETIIAAIRAEMKRRLAADPASVPGWALEPGNERRVVTDTQLAFQRLADKLDAGVFAGCCTVKIGDLEKAWVKATKRPGDKKEDCIADLEERLGPWLEKKQNQPSLKRKE